MNPLGLMACKLSITPIKLDVFLVFRAVIKVMDIFLFQVISVRNYYLSVALL
jgi:hypothetical protein